MFVVFEQGYWVVVDYIFFGWDDIDIVWVLFYCCVVVEVDCVFSCYFIVDDCIFDGVVGFIDFGVGCYECYYFLFFVLVKGLEDNLVYFCVGGVFCWVSYVVYLWIFGLVRRSYVFLFIWERKFLFVENFFVYCEIE